MQLEAKKQAIESSYRHLQAEIAKENAKIGQRARAQQVFPGFGQQQRPVASQLNFESFPQQSDMAFG